MCCTDTSVNDVDVDTGTECLIGEGVGEVLQLRRTGGTSIARDTLQTPRSRGLSAKRLDRCLLFNNVDLGVVGKVLSVGVADVKDHDLNIAVGRLPLDNIALVVLKLQLVEVLLNTLELSSLVALKGNDVLLGLVRVVAELGRLVADETLAGGKDSGDKGQKTGDGEGSPHFGL